MPGPILRSLQTRAQFEAALKSQVLARSEHFALHRLVIRHPDAHENARAQRSRAEAEKPIRSGPAFQEPAFGVLVPKRWATRAVTRNLIKRQARELARHSLAGRAEGIYLLRLRKSWGPSFQAARSLVLAGEVRRQIQGLFLACPL